MIVSCAPFRVSFAGGGSDIASFYRKQRGAVLSCAIAKYSFIVVHPFFNASKYHLKYTRTELVDHIEEIHHPILREALRMEASIQALELCRSLISRAARDLVHQAHSRSRSSTRFTPTAALLHPRNPWPAKHVCWKSIGSASPLASRINMLQPMAG